MKGKGKVESMIIDGQEIDLKPVDLSNLEGYKNPSVTFEVPCTINPILNIQRLYFECLTCIDKRGERYIIPLDFFFGLEMFSVRYIKPFLWQKMRG